MIMTSPVPDYEEIVNAILNEGDPDIDGLPVGIQEYYLSGHSKDIDIIDGFEYTNEWIAGQPALKEFLEKELSDWWEDQLHDDPEIFRGWLDGNDVKISMEGYLETLINDLVGIYRERITETWTCEECGKEISEKHPHGHPDSIVRVGIPKDYPDGLPEGVHPSDVEYTKHLYCNTCHRKLFLNR